MNDKTKKTVRTGAIIFASILGAFGLYKGIKIVSLKLKPGETGGADKVITLSNGTTITVSADQASKPSNADIENLKYSLQKWIFAGKVPQSNANKIIEGAKKITKYELQKLMFLLDRGNPSISGFELSAQEKSTFLSLLTSIAKM